MEHLNFNQLRTFWMVAREGSIQAASERLHVTPASVSSQMKQLQRSMKIQLLQKQGRGIAVTEAGRRVAKTAERVFAIERELLNGWDKQLSADTLRLRVGVCDVVPKLVAAELIQPALDSPAEIKLDCLEGPLHNLIADLSIDKLDIVLSDRPLDPSYRVKAHSYRLGRTSIVIAATPKLADRYQAAFPESLQNAPFLVPSIDTVMRRELDRWFDEHSLSVRVRGEFDDSAMMKIMARRSMGLIPISQNIATEVESIYGLVPVGVATPLQESFYAVVPDGKKRHAAVEAIIDAAAG